MKKNDVIVAVRVRPFNDRELRLGSECCVQMTDTMTTLKDQFGNKRDFTFDYSFWSHDGFEVDKDGYSSKSYPESPFADQQLVYSKLGAQVLDNAWEGYHCCLFAYGQTGSGKSYSMIGYGKNEGIVPLVCDEIFKRIESNQDKNNFYEVYVSMLEIYNEKIQDLLEQDPNKKPTSGLKVRQNQKGMVWVDKLSKHAVDSYEAIAKKMDEGYTSRSIGATLMNQTSSRAHTIITIEFKQIRHSEQGRVQKLSCINLVDLAGSEKAG